MKKALSIVVLVLFVLTTAAFAQKPDPWGLAKGNKECSGKYKVAVGQPATLTELGQYYGNVYGWLPSVSVAPKFQEYDTSGNLSAAIQQFASNLIPSAYCPLAGKTGFQGQFGRTIGAENSKSNLDSPDYIMVIAYGIISDETRGREINLDRVGQQAQRFIGYNSRVFNTVADVVGDIGKANLKRKVSGMISISLYTPAGRRVGSEVTSTGTVEWTEYEKTNLPAVSQVALNNPTAIELAEKLVRSAFEKLPR